MVGWGGDAYARGVLPLGCTVGWGDPLVYPTVVRSLREDVIAPIRPNVGEWEGK